MAIEEMVTNMSITESGAATSSPIFTITLLVFTILLLIADTVTLKKKARTSYIISVLILILIMAVFTGETITFLSIMMTLIIVALYILITKIRMMTNKTRISQNDNCNNLNFGFYLSISNIIMLLYALLLF